jgi:hypothetical protein
MADDDAALGEQILNVAEAEVESKVQPDSVSDDLGREAIAMVMAIGPWNTRRQALGEAYRSSPLNLTTPTMHLLRG